MPTYKDNLIHGASPSVFRNAKLLRKKMTEPERLLWMNLRNKKLSGYKFRRQHPLGRYIADFYCHERKLAIELDGSHHELPDEKKYDSERTFTLKLDEIKVLRFKNNEVLKNLGQVLKKIKLVLTLCQ